MALTEFGKAIRKARIDASVTLGMMADALGVTPPFLSAMENGRKKVPSDLVQKSKQFFAEHHVNINNLEQLAAVANNSVPLDGLSPRQQMLVAGFARSSFDAETLEKFASLLASTDGSKK